MKIRHLLLTLVGLAIGLALPTFAQQPTAPDPQLRQALDDLFKTETEAYNNNDAAAFAALFTKDAVLVTNTGPVYGSEAIEKYQAAAFKEGHFSNFTHKWDQYSPHMIGPDGKEVWSNGEWSLTWQGKTGDPIPLNGYWSSISVLDSDGVWKDKMQTWNITPAPAATASPTASPSNK